jgi:hydrogenase small subunit
MAVSPANLKEKGKGPDPLTTGVVGLAAGAVIGAGIMLAKKLPNAAPTHSGGTHDLDQEPAD